MTITRSPIRSSIGPVSRSSVMTWGDPAPSVVSPPVISGDPTGIGNVLTITHAVFDETAVSETHVLLRNGVQVGAEGLVSYTTTEDNGFYYVISTGTNAEENTRTSRSNIIYGNDLAMTELSRDRRPMPVNPAMTLATIPISGTVGEYAEAQGVEAQVIDKDGAAVTSYSDIALAGDGTFSTTIQMMPVLALLRVRLRVKGTGHTVTMTNQFTTPLTAVTYGQSNSVLGSQPWSTPPYLVAIETTTSTDCGEGGVDVPLDHHENTVAGAIDSIANQIAEYGNLPVHFIVGGQGASVVAALADPTYQANINLMAGITDHGGPVHAIIWNQGENDAVPSLDGATYLADLESIRTQIAGVTGQDPATINIMVSGLGTSDGDVDGTRTNADRSRFNAIQKEFKHYSSGIHFTADFADMSHVDMFHARDRSYERRARREGLRWSEVLGYLTPPPNGFEITSMTRVDATTTDVKVRHGHGTDFEFWRIDHDYGALSEPEPVVVTELSAGVFTISDDNYVTQEDCTGARRDYETIRLTHSAVAMTGCLTRFMWGFDPGGDVNTCVVDNSAWSMPLGYVTDYVPDQEVPTGFADGDWSLNPGDGVIYVVITNPPSTLPPESVKTMSYLVDGVRYDRTVAEAFTDFEIAAPNGVPVSVQLITTNIVGDSPPSAAKTVTPAYQPYTDVSVISRTVGARVTCGVDDTHTQSIDVGGGGDMLVAINVVGIGYGPPGEEVFIGGKRVSMFSRALNYVNRAMFGLVRDVPAGTVDAVVRGEDGQDFSIFVWELDGADILSATLQNTTMTNMGGQQIVEHFYDVEAGDFTAATRTDTNSNPAVEWFNLDVQNPIVLGVTPYASADRIVVATNPALTLGVEVDYSGSGCISSIHVPKRSANTVTTGANIIATDWAYSSPAAITETFTFDAGPGGDAVVVLVGENASNAFSSITLDGIEITRVADVQANSFYKVAGYATGVSAGSVDLVMTLAAGTIATTTAHMIITEGVDVTAMTGAWQAIADGGIDVVEYTDSEPSNVGDMLIGAYGTLWSGNDMTFEPSIIGKYVNRNDKIRSMISAEIVRAERTDGTITCLTDFASKSHIIALRVPKI